MSSRCRASGAKVTLIRLERGLLRQYPWRTYRYPPVDRPVITLGTYGDPGLSIYKSGGADKRPGGSGRR